MSGAKRRPDPSVTEHERPRPSSPPFCLREKTVYDQCATVEGSDPGQGIGEWPGPQLPPVHSTETNLCEISVKELRGLWGKSRSPLLARLFHSFSSPWMLAGSPAAVSPSLLGAHYNPSLQDQR